MDAKSVRSLGTVSVARCLRVCGCAYSKGVLTPGFLGVWVCMGGDTSLC